MGNMFKCGLKQGGSSGSGADLIVTCSAEFAGATITASKTGSTSQTQTCPSTSPYVVTFSGLDNGTWTVSGTISGQTYSVQATITDFSAILNSGFNWQSWVDSAQYLDSSDYNDLDEVLADEEAVRELALEHNCVDYLASFSAVNNDLEKVINNDIFAKWVNLADYSLDKMYAVPAIKTVMDTADKYGYGEWCLMPQVPTMTSNTAPYGEASASSVAGSQDAYRAFDGIGSDWWSSNNTAVDQYITYDFVEAIEVKKLALSGRRATNSVDQSPKDFRLLGSNDNWNTSTEIGSYTYDGNSNIDSLGIQEFDVTNTNTYKSLRIAIDSVHPSNNNVISINLIQFYAYAPKGNVPVMTSNSAPYGGVISTGTAVTGYDKYKAFDGDASSSYSVSGTANTVDIGYHFTNPISVKAFSYNIAFSQSSDVTLQPSYSDDGSNWTDTDESYTYLAADNGTTKRFNLDKDYGYHLYWRVTRTAASKSGVANELQFYGRQLSVSVPVMTGNTTPYGTAGASSISASSNDAYKAFDGSDSSEWAPSGTSGGEKVYYHFVSPIIPKKVNITIPSAHASRITKGTIIGSNDGTNWTPLGETSTIGTSLSLDLDNDTEYAYVGLECTNVTDRPYIGELQFYGFDYSEKEFEPGTTKKWLYDHGVELESMNPVTVGSGIITRKESDQLYIETPASSGSQGHFLADVDLTPYNLLRAKLGNEGHESSNLTSNDFGALTVWSQTPSGGSTGRIAHVYILTGDKNLPNNDSLDITSINQSAKVGISSGFNNLVRVYTCSELWLE